MSKTDTSRFCFYFGLKSGTIFVGWLDIISSILLSGIGCYLLLNFDAIFVKIYDWNFNQKQGEC